MSNSIAPGSSADVNVRVTALTTNPNVPVTYKTIILKKNLVNGVNTVTQAMMSAQNTKYVIKYDYVLGEDIIVPANCVIEFDGGSLNGSSLTGNNTFVNINQSTCIFNNIKMLGSFYAKELPLNLYNTTKIDYLYTLLQSFSGTNFVLNANYSVTETDNTVDGTTPHTLNIDGRGYTLTLHSFGAYNITKCSIKNITIEVQNNSVGTWHTDVFKFGLLGYYTTSTLSLYNVTLTSGAGKIYTRGFKSTYISNCIEDGVGFYVASTHCVTVKNCRIINADEGYFQLNDNFTPDNEDYTIIDNCYFKNITNGGIILSGGVKMNPSVINCTLINVGSGGATQACINFHPKGTVKIIGNKIIPNVGASMLDIDGANQYFDINTTVFVSNNILSTFSNDETIHAVALVGLGKLYLSDNSITNGKLYFWDVPYFECKDNIWTYTKPFTESISISEMNVHDYSINYDYIHYYINNIYSYNAKSDAYVKFSYNISNKKVTIYSYGTLIRGDNSKRITLTHYYTNLNVYGDIDTYDKSLQYTKNVNTENLYSTGFAPIVKYNNKGLRRYNPDENREYRGSYIGLVDIFGNPADTLYFGNTANRPALCLPGTCYYDVTLHKNIYAIGTSAKLRVQITSALLHVDGEVTRDDVFVYMSKCQIYFRRQIATDSDKSIDNIFEDVLKPYVQFKNKGIISYSQVWSDSYYDIYCPWVGTIGDDYGVIHSNTVNGYTTEYSIVNDGTISWVEEDGAAAGVNRSGTFANKPVASNIYVGFKYFCTDKQTTEGATNGIEIIHKGSDVWVDALGRTVN